MQERATAFGRLGRELAAIDAGMWAFKRPLLGREPPQAVQTVPLVEQPPTALPYARAASPAASRSTRHRLAVA